MAKAKRGLLLSVLTLLIAIAVTATSTYAWFAANSSVQATNMQLTLKTNTSFLVIGTSDSVPANVDAIGSATTVAATASTAEVLPVRYRETGEDPTSGNTRWEYQAGTSYTNGAASGATTVVASGSENLYTVHYVFYVGLASNTQEAATNLKVAALSAVNGADATTVFLPAISAVVKVSGSGVTTKVIDFENINSNTAINTDPGAVLSGTVALNTVYTIDVWVYVNGDNSAVTSSNATTANLGSFTVAMTLTVD